MSKVELVLDRDGLMELMKSQEVIGFMKSQANEIVGRCQGNYEIDEWNQGKSRANVSIKTTDRKTLFSNMKTNELLTALGGSK